MNDIQPGARSAYLDAMYDKPEFECPYCGGRGDEEWFETHEHVNPFGDEDAA